MVAAPARFPSREPRLSAAETAGLREGAVWVEFSRGEILMLDGTPPGHVLLIARGVVKITAESGAGTPKLLAFRGRGQLVGDFGCIDGGPGWGTVEAIDAVGAWRIPADRFLRALRADTELCLAVLATTVARVREADAKIGEYGEYSAGDRLIRLLARFAVACREDDRAESVTVPVGQAELAGCAGVARETVCRTVNVLSGLGIAHAKRGRIEVDDVPALLRAAQRTENRREAAEHWAKPARSR
jgi:CRP/FNR family transcriptional regulator, cyclic AMP receptor protein